MPLDLERRFARRTLASWPSPIHPLPRLSAAIGVEVWAKRDDIPGGRIGAGRRQRHDVRLPFEGSLRAGPVAVT